MENSPEDFKIQKAGREFSREFQNSKSWKRILQRISKFKKLGEISPENFKIQKALENSPENFKIQKLGENSPEDFKIILRRILQSFLKSEKNPPVGCKLSKVDSVWRNFIFKNKVEIFPG